MSGTMVGTPAFMSPEQAAGDDAGAPSDLFSLAAVLTYAATGSGPFGRTTNPMAMLLRIADDEPDTSGLPAALRPHLEPCLAKNPDERWQVAGDVKRQLEWIAASGRSTVLQATAGQRLGRGVRVSLTGAVMGALMALIAGGALTWYVRTGPHEQTASRHVTRSTIATSGMAALAIRPGRSLAITPDGTRVVYIGNNGKQLFVRPTDRDHRVRQANDP
jgi:hypothetical protein